MKKFGIIFIIFTLMLSRALVYSAANDIFYEASRIEDKSSIKLNSANYRHFLSEPSNNWLIFFYESLQLQSLMAYKEWVNFTLNKIPDVKFGIIDFSFEKILAQKLKIPSVPCYLYIIDGYIYYYTEDFSRVNLKRLIFEEVYLQYNRRLLSLNESKDEPLAIIKKSYTNYPGILILTIFTIFFTCFSSTKCLVTLFQKNLKDIKLKKD